MAEGIDIEGIVFEAARSDAPMRGRQAETAGQASGQERSVSAELQEEDLALDRSLRPKYLKDYLGQARIKESLAIMIEAAKARGEAVDHILFSGPPGLGKTTLATVVANEVGANIKQQAVPLSSARVILRRSSHRLKRATCCSSTRFTA